MSDAPSNTPDAAFSEAGAAADGRRMDPAREAASASNRPAARVGSAVPVPPDETPQPFPTPSLENPQTAANGAPIDLLDDVELDVRIELGRTEMYIEDVLKLGVGSVIELDKLAGDPVEIFVNEQRVARGEVIVLNDNFCVRISDILSPIPELDTPR